MRLRQCGHRSQSIVIMPQKMNQPMNRNAPVEPCIRGEYPHTRATPETTHHTV